MKEIVIVGAGGFGREVLALLRTVNHDWLVIGFADDLIPVGTKIGGLEVLSNIESLKTWSQPLGVVIAIGNPRTRKAIYDSLSQCRGTWFPNIISPNAVLMGDISLGEGNIVCAGAILTTDIQIGSFNIINLSCTIGHDVRIADFCTMAPMVSLSGYTRLETGVDLGTKATVIPGRAIGQWSVIGAGGVVISDIAAHSTAVGVPARVIKQETGDGSGA